MKIYCWLCAAIVVVSVAAGRADARPPNLVVIISDDQTYTDFGFMGHPWIRTPHLDRLAEQSARYPNGYVPSSLCRPSLATLMTGLYPHQHGIHFNHPPPGFGGSERFSDAEQYYRWRATAEGLIAETPTLPRTLAKHGYRSFQAGKHWEGSYSQAGFTHGMTRNRGSEPAAHGNRTLVDGSIVAHGNGDYGLRIGRSTMQPIWEFIDDHLKHHTETPFLVWYAPFLPHVPHDAPEPFRKLYLDNPEVPRDLVNYSAACTWFDESVGQLVEAIESRGLAEQTLFLFVVDNGYRPDPASGGDPNARWHRRTKYSPFEGGVRTPIFIRWDGHVVPASYDRLVSSIDVVPTLLEAAASSGEMGELPGLSLLPSARGDVELPERPVYGEIYPGDASALRAPEGDIAYRWVRERDWKLIVPHRQRGEIWRSFVTSKALFNLADDPDERHNLAQDPRFASTRARLERLLDDWWMPAATASKPTSAPAER